MRIFSLVAVLVAAVVAVGGSGAGTKKVSGATRIDVSTRSAVVHYLRSIGVNPRKAVIQRGVRNYAGPNCPGKGWRCATTRHTVVQIAKPGGRNRFVCRSARCVVVQLAPGSRVRSRPTRSFKATAAAKPNSGVCIKTTGLTQTCTINQSSSSGDNTAIVYEDAGKTSGLTQTLLYTASITQKATGSSNKNIACVHQKTNMEGNTVGKKGQPINVNFESHQSIAITQDSAHGGNQAKQSATSAGTCTGSSLEQTQTLSSLANGSGPITQNQNALSNGPNMTLDVRQNQSPAFFGTAAGENFAIFAQTNTLTAIANTAGGDVTQTQSSVDTGNGDGGILASVNQDSRDKSTADATQTETQCEDAASAPAPALTDCKQTADSDFTVAHTLTQIQHGPASVSKGAPKGNRHVYSVKKGGCCSVQTGSPDDHFLVTQSSTQFNDTGQHQTNTIQGDCKTDGSCTANQTATIQGQTSTQSQTGTDLDVQTTCVGPTCFSENGAQLTATNTKISEFGVGGMRGNGTGSIAVTGVPGTVARALLYWNGPTNSSDPAANASVTFNGTAVTGANIGIASDNCWGFQNSQSYRADVTSLVSANDATYTLSDFVKAGGIDVNGAALVVFSYDGDAPNYRNVSLWNGNDSNVASGTEPAGWNETISGVQYPGSGSASLDTIVSDGQFFDDPALVLNGNTLAPDGPIFQGASVPPPGGNNLWDVEHFDITSLLTGGTNSLNLTSGDPFAQPLPSPNDVGWDCLSLVVAAANVPASGPAIMAPSAGAASHHTSTSHGTSTPAFTSRGVGRAGGIR